MNKSDKINNKKMEQEVDLNLIALQELKESNRQYMKTKGELYNAFVEAGLEREARCLSTTVKGDKKYRPGIGRVVAVLDNMLELEAQFPDIGDSPERKAFFEYFADKLFNYANFPEGLYKKIRSAFEEGKNKSKLMRNYLEAEKNYIREFNRR